MRLPKSLALFFSTCCLVPAWGTRALRAESVSNKAEANNSRGSGENDVPLELRKHAILATKSFAFKIPRALESMLIKDGESYQKIAHDPKGQWKLVVDFGYSEQHWKEGVVAYVNQKAYDTYMNNYYTYLRDLEFDCDKDDEDEPACGPDSFKYQPYQVDAILLKENFQLKGVNGFYQPIGPTSVTMMVKRKAGFDPKYGDWEYMEWNAEGEIKLRGKGSEKKVYSRCSKCHSGVGDRFFIFSDMLAANLLEKEKISKKNVGKSK